MKIVNLEPDGDKIPVTLVNRREFVQLSAQYRLYDSIEEQLEALLESFYESILKDLVTNVRRSLRLGGACLTPLSVQRAGTGAVDLGHAGRRR